MSNPPTIVVYTSITGGKDALKERQETEGLRFYAFLDEVTESATWRVYPALNLFHDPRRNARMHKVLCHQFFPKADYTVWIDGTIEVTADIRPLVLKMMEKCEIATFKHPERNCLYEEAEACKSNNLDAGPVIENQVERYRSQGFPRNAGLFESNVLIRKNSPKVRAFNELWWSEICRFSRRDQLSLPYALSKARLPMGIIPGNAQYMPHLNPKRNGSRYFRWYKHATKR